MNVYLIKSVSLRLLNEEINHIIEGKENITRVNMDEFTIHDLISECSYYSLLNEPKIVIANNFKVNKESKELETYLNEENKNTTLILISELVDKRSTIYKLISKKGKVIIIDEIKNINKKIEDYAKELEVEISFRAITKLLENNLNNYDLALNELDKMSLALKKIDIDEVNKYSKRIISEENFEFCDAVIKKEYPKFNNYLDDFINLKQEVAPFIGLLASQYRLMYAVKQLEGSNDEIAKDLNVHPYRVKLAKDKGYLYTQNDLEKILIDLCELDYSLKTTNIDKYVLLKIFIVNI